MSTAHECIRFAETLALAGPRNDANGLKPALLDALAFVLVEPDRTNAFGSASYCALAPLTRLDLPSRPVRRH